MNSGYDGFHALLNSKGFRHYQMKCGFRSVGLFGRGCYHGSMYRSAIAGLKRIAIDNMEAIELKKGHPTWRRDQFPEDRMFERLFSPRGVAVIGASQNPTKLGYGVARNLVVSNYPGNLYFINPRGGHLFDRPIYPNLASVPDPVDLAVILIPAPSVPGALEDCGRRGIHFVIIGSGGFRETGLEGEALEQQCLGIAHQYGIRVIGPNCIGFLDTHLPIDATFLPLPGPIPGDIAFLSHSGAICEAVIDWARGQGFGLSRLVSLGNQMDLTETDLLQPVAEDGHTRVITMYLEGVGNGRAFIEQTQKVTRKVPVVAIKVGRSALGQLAVASHTGAFAGEDRVYDAALQKAGVIRAQTSEELFDWARALAWCPLPYGRRMAVLTNAGGPGAIAIDALDANALTASELASDTIDRLRALLPPAASLRNPVDMLASAGPMEYANCLRALLDDQGVDGVMVILPPPPMTTAAEVAGAIIPVIRSTTKPVILTLMGEELIAHAARLFRQAHIPEYRFPERAASALAVLVKRSEQLKEQHFPPERFEDVDKQCAADWLRGAQAGKDRFMSPSVAARVVACYGISVPAGALAGSEQEAAQLAEGMGFPVVLKAASQDLPHKSDIGGVVTDLDSVPSVLDAYRQIIQDMEKKAPFAQIEGVLVQKMISGGQDVILGIVRDPQFGPLLMFGSGGVEVEGLRDVAFGLAPISHSEAESLLERTWAGRKLRGYRSLVPVDREAVIESLQRLAQMATDFPQVAEIEVNPLRVLPGKGGAFALDVRLRVNSES
jgi:acetyl coenzyme A synthetase (ADP forming)-like protein